MEKFRLCNWLASFDQERRTSTKIGSCQWRSREQTRQSSASNPGSEDERHAAGGRHHGRFEDDHRSSLNGTESSSSAPRCLAAVYKKSLMKCSIVGCFPTRLGSPSTTPEKQRSVASIDWLPVWVVVIGLQRLIVWLFAFLRLFAAAVSCFFMLWPMSLDIVGHFFCFDNCFFLFNPGFFRFSDTSGTRRKTTRSRRAGWSSKCPWFHYGVWCGQPWRVTVFSEVDRKAATETGALEGLWRRWFLPFLRYC